jgi:hypothetical protein
VAYLHTENTTPEGIVKVTNIPARGILSEESWAHRQGEKTRVRAGAKAAAVRVFLYTCVVFGMHWTMPADVQLVRSRPCLDHP